jgi:SnoaL-like polyketide cyclase
MRFVRNVSELNKEKLQLFVEAVWNQGLLDLIDDLVADDYLGRLSGLDEDVLGPEGVRKWVANRRLVHPGLHIAIEDQIAEEDRVVMRWRATAGTLPTTTMCCAGISVVRLLAGMQVEAHTECSRHG